MTVSLNGRKAVSDIGYLESFIKSLYSITQ